MSTTTTWIILGAVVVLLAILFGLAFLIRLKRKSDWEKKKAIGDKTDDSDEFPEPKLEEAGDYIVWYVVSPLLNLFVEKGDKYFTYFGWIADAIEVCITLYIIYQFMVVGGTSCCNYQSANAICSETGEAGIASNVDKLTFNATTGWCIVDNIACEPPTETCLNGADAMKLCSNTKKAANTWNYIIVGILAVKLIKIILDYYITIMEVRQKKKIARINLEKLEKVQSKSDRETVTLEEEESVKLCGIIDTGSQKFAQALMYIWLIGIVLSFVVLYTIDSNSGLLFTDCGTATVSINGEDTSTTCTNYKSSCSYSGNLYVVNNSNVDLEGPAIIGIIASVLGYILYVPWIRDKVDDYMIEKGWISAESNTDKQTDYEMWMGLL